MGQLDEKKQREEEKKYPNAWAGRKTVLHVLQQLSLVGGAAFLCFVIMGAVICVEEVTETTGGVKKENYYYQIGQEKAGTAFEESALFHKILGEDISDVIRLGAVRGQLEKDGKYYGRKEIDITAFANRHYGTQQEYVTAKYYLDDLLKWAKQGFVYKEGWVSQEETAKFLNKTSVVTRVDVSSLKSDVEPITYLNSDLEAVTYVADVSGNMLQKAQTSVKVKGDLQEYHPREAISEEEISRYYITESESQDDLSGGTFLSESQGIIYDLTSEEGNTYVTLLENRYQSAEKRNIEKYVSSWEEYNSLSNVLSNAAYDLLTNYGIYERLGSHFSKSKSNLRYCIFKTVGDKVEVLSNQEVWNGTWRSVRNPEGALVYSKGNQKEMTGAAMKEEFLKGVDSYIMYDSANQEYTTNTLISEETMRHIVKGYQYAYPADTQIWIGVDTDYPMADTFAQARERFNGYVPYYMKMLFGAVFSFLVYLCLLVVLTRMTGSEADEEGKRIIRLRKEDRVPMELLLVLMGLCVAGILAGLYACFHILTWNNISAYEILTGAWTIPAYMVLALLCSLLFSFFYYGLVRRMKAKSIWKDSLCRKLLLLAGGTVRFVYNNSGVLIRVLIPVLVLAVLHVLLAVIGTWSDGTEIGVCLLLLDILLGVGLYLSAKARNHIVDGIKKINAGDTRHKVEEKNLYGDNLILARAVNNIGESISSAVETSMKDERLKADLITNVSHDIKTPLTSIINYIDLIKRENITDEKVKAYVAVLDSKSQRLKQLTDDLVEASKISSGNISLHWENINLVELIHQTIGEFSEKFEGKELEIKVRAAGNTLMIRADSRRIWRVIENLFHNICKYALRGTRVYIDIQEEAFRPEYVVLSVKNISEQPLRIRAEELTERFIRGDESRSTEGSGLGLSIAKSLTEVQNGKFEIITDGDLFKVMLTFPLLEQN